MRQVEPTIPCNVHPMKHTNDAFDHQPRDFDHLQVIHVAGTKGKGSTSALTQSILHHYPLDRPLRTGLFTSPHLVAVRERIRINGKPISEEMFAKYSEDIWTRLEDTKDQYIPLGQDSTTTDRTKLTLQDQRAHPDKPVYFRYLTLLALHAFVQEKVTFKSIYISQLCLLTCLFTLS